MAAHHTEADRNVREALHFAAAASAPFYQGCHFPHPYGPGCPLPSIVPAVEPEAYMQQHYGGDQNMGTCWFPPGIPLGSGQGSSSFMQGHPGNETAAITRQMSGPKELALLPGCEFSSPNDQSNQVQVQEQQQTSAIVEDAVCIGARSGVGRAESQHPAARARRGGSGFQSAQNLSLSLFQSHPAVGQAPLVIPDPVKLRAKKKEKGTVVELGLTISPNQAAYLSSASSSLHIPTKAASSAPTLTAPNGSDPSPPKSNAQVNIGNSNNSRMAANLSAGGGNQQRTALKDSRFMNSIADLLQEVCHLTIVQQARQRPGHPAVRQGEAVDPAADPRLGPARAPAPRRANLPVPLRLETATAIELENEKLKLLKMLEEVKSFNNSKISLILSVPSIQQCICRLVV